MQLQRVQVTLLQETSLVEQALEEKPINWELLEAVLARTEFLLRYIGECAGDDLMTVIEAALPHHCGYCAHRYDCAVVILRHAEAIGAH